MFVEKVEYQVESSPEYVINLLSKHSLNVYGVKIQEKFCTLKINAKDSLKFERILRNYGKKYNLKRSIGGGKNLKNFAKRAFYYLGLLVGILSATLYSFLVTDIKVEGNARIEESTIISAIENEIKFPFLGRGEDVIIVENLVRKIEGVSYASIKKEGRVLCVKIVEELPKVEKIDTQNLVSIIAKESGVITKMVVLGGTALVGVGSEVKEGQELIAPYLINASEEKKPTLAIGRVEAKVRRLVELIYPSEEEYEKRFSKEFFETTEKIKNNLLEEDQFLGSDFLVKSVDKTIVCSIYYDIITRIA